MASISSPLSVQTKKVSEYAMKSPPSNDVVIRLVHDGPMNATLNDIGWYAKEHDLTPGQVRRFFEVGIAANNNLNRPASQLAQELYG
jgi:hypothetical protein